ncbi:MAG: efflux RND transporter periplasmic adaptor subunit [Pseudoruegeria sp.]
MVIILGLYALLVWLVFSKLKLLPWNRGTKTGVYGIAIVIALVVIGALNYQTPTGTVSVQGAMIDITPNVSGTVVHVEAEPNSKVKKGDVLFRIDDTTYVAEIARLEASLVAARTAEAQLETDLEVAKAEITRLESQLLFGIQRRDDIVKLSERGASSDFQMQEAVSTIEQLEASLVAARARKASIVTRIASEIDGVDAGVAEVEQLLVQARWSLDQTVVTAPNDGVVATLSLRVGNRVTPLRSAMTFFAPNDRVMAVVFPQSAAHGVKPGDVVRVAMRTLPGQAFETTVRALPIGTSEGIIDARGQLPSLRELTGAGGFIASLEIPEDLPEEAIRLGSSGKALRITDDAGGVKVLAEVLFWFTKLTNYL